MSAVRPRAIPPTMLGALMISGALLLFGAMAMTLSLIPFPMMKASVDRLAPDGSAEPFDRELFQGMILKLRVTGGLLAIGGLVGWRRRRSLSLLIEQAIPRVRASSQRFWEVLRDEMGHALQREDRPSLFALAGITLIGALVRIPWLGAPLRYDEAVTFIYFAAPPWYVALSNYAAANNHVLHTILVHVVTRVLGDQPWILRLPALLAGLAVIPMTYLVVRQLYHTQAALLAAGLVSSSSLFVEYSASARGYTLWCLLFLIAMALGIFLRTHRFMFGWAVLAAVCALGFYTMPLMLYPFGVLMTWLWLSAMAHDVGDRSARPFSVDLAWILGLTGLLVVALYTPILLTSGTRAILQHGLLAPLSWPVFGVKFQEALGAIWSAWHRGMPAWGTALLSLGVVIATLWHSQIARHRVRLLIAVGLWCLPVVLLQRLVPYVRFSLFLVPLYVGVASAGLVLLIQRLLNASPRLERSLVLTAALAVTCGMGCSLARESPFQRSEQTGLVDAPSIARFLKSYLREGDRVVAITPSDAPLLYYFRREAAPTRYLYSDLQESRRMIIVVNTARGQTLESVMGVAGLSSPQAEAASVLHTYPSAVLYEFHPLRASYQ